MVKNYLYSSKVGPEKMSGKEKRNKKIPLKMKDNALLVGVPQRAQQSKPEQIIDSMIAE